MKLIFVTLALIATCGLAKPTLERRECSPKEGKYNHTYFSKTVNFRLITFAELCYLDQECCEGLSCHPIPHPDADAGVCFWFLRDGADSFEEWKLVGAVTYVQASPSWILPIRSGNNEGLLMKPLEFPVDYRNGLGMVSLYGRRAYFWERGRSFSCWLEYHNWMFFLLDFKYLIHQLIDKILALECCIIYTYFSFEILQSFIAFRSLSGDPNFGCCDLQD